MDLTFPLWFEVASIAVIVAVLLVDLALVVRRPHIPTARESSAWIGFYVGLAIVFGIVLIAVGNSADPRGARGYEAGIQFYAGWMTEYSLSADNLFVFLIIMGRFAVPKRMQQELLMAGILLALVFRVIFILLGAALLANYSWLFYVFGGYLVYIAIQQLRKRDGQSNSFASPVMRWLHRVLRVHPEWHDAARWRTRVNGSVFFTPAILVLVSLGFVDLLFALDSIPAIFGITTSPFLVAAANVFALMGLRQLYFLLGDILDRSRFLGHGIAVILVFIGVKLVNHALRLNALPFLGGGRPIELLPEIPTWVSLVVIVATLTVAVLAGVAASRRESK